MVAVTITQITPPELEVLINNAVNKALSGYKQPKQSEEDSLLTISQAANLLNLSVQTLYEKTAKHLIPFSKKGKRLYFSRKELLRWVNEGQRKTLSEIQAETGGYIKQKGGSK